MAGLVMAGDDDTMYLQRRVVYIDQYHAAILPGQNITTGITHAIMAFANSSLFTTDPPGTYEPFMKVSDFRAMFDNGTKIGIAIGGWGDTAGFSQGCMNNDSQVAYANNVKKMTDDLSFDFVDIDWEYPGGNGADYKQIPNSNKTSEIDNFGPFLRAIKTALGDKQLSIAVPGTQPDMLAYTNATSKLIFDSVDMINLMSYDLMMRRSNETKHHTSVQGARSAVWNYLDQGAPASKINLGFAFYAKYFQTPANATCDGPVGCPIVAAENADGSDAQTSGAMTFEAANVGPAPPPEKLATTGDGTCGAATAGLTCAGRPDAPCCSQYGYCGASAEHCGPMCQPAYGSNCTGPDARASFRKARAHGRLDEARGGMWYWDAERRLYWTWESVDLMVRKYDEIVAPLRLGGVMVWSLGEDSAGWCRVRVLAAVGDENRPRPECMGHMQEQVAGNVSARALRAHSFHKVH
ncbi:glycoside hydrolase family 18 protein [Hypoxylon cercidicola]|nr:glycoside hydrolase family 18 protein [Hypoxylon cercidicola]